MLKSKIKEDWQGGKYLTTAHDYIEASIIETELKAGGIPCIKKQVGSGEYMRIYLGASANTPIDIYVPEAALEDARNILEPFEFDTEMEIDSKI